MTVLFVFVSIWVVACCKYALSDPCLEAEPLINQYRRSINYTFGDEGESAVIDDQDLPTGWYIFPGGQGDEMPTAPPPGLIGKCGTYSPIWLSGELPQKEGEERDGLACVVISPSELCGQQYPITVRRCADNYAYYLPSTAANMAYCMGEELKCPDGQTSATGFTPGCVSGDFVTLINDPHITFRVLEDVPDFEFREVVLQCNLEHNETNIEIDVEWYIDSKMVKEVLNVPYDQLTNEAELFEADWVQDPSNGDNIRNLPATAMCKVRAKYEGEDLLGPERHNTYWMGFTMDSNSLIVEESSETPDYVIVRPTIPVLQPVASEDLTGFELLVEVMEPAAGGEGAFCPTGQRLKQTAVKSTSSNCNITIPMIKEITPETKVELPVYAAGDSKVDGDIQVSLVLRTVKEHPWHPVWSNYLFDQIKVLVRDKDSSVTGKMCYAADDPHMRTSDGRRYENQMTGEFWMYRHTSLPIGVQAYFQDAGSYSRVCGAAVRSGNDLFIYDHCRSEQGEAIREYMAECGDLQMKVDKTDSLIIIELPNGALVHLCPTAIHIYPGTSDLQRLEGLCGQFDGICNNDFIASDGSDWSHVDPCTGLLPDCSNEASCPTFHNTEFSVSWRVAPEDSYYQGKLPDHVPKGEIAYCTCEEVVNPDTGRTEFVTVCSPENVLVCTPDNDAVSPESQCMDRELARLSGEGTDDVIDEVGPFQYDANFTAPDPIWRDGWDETTARDNCNTYFQQLAAFEECTSLPDFNLDQFTNICVLDIQIVASDENNLLHASSILSNCLHTIMRNMSLFEVNNDTVSGGPPRDMVKDICPNNCNLQGTCQQGVCICDDGYFGSDCFYSDSYVPTLYSLPSGGMCDRLERPCQQTPVTGHYFLNKTTLMCHITPVLLTTTGEKFTQDKQLTEGRFDHVERVMCLLPVPTIPDNMDLLTVAFHVSVSNNGETGESDSKPLTVLHSTCMECTDHFECTQKAGTCVIDNACYTAGDPSSDPCLYCDPTRDQNNWSKTSECQQKTAAVIGGSVAAIALVVVGSVIAVVIVKKKVIKPNYDVKRGSKVEHADNIEVDNIECVTSRTELTPVDA